MPGGREATRSSSFAVRRLLAVGLGAFGFFGIFWGTFAVLLANLSASLDLSPGPLGLALSAVVPIEPSPSPGISSRAGVAISVVTTLGYGGFLLGPVVVGDLAELLGLRVALGTIAVAGLMIFTLALRPRAF